MKNLASSLTVLFGLALSQAVQAAPVVQAAQALMPCSGNSTLPCSCPAGTTYSESGTYVITGAGSTDFLNVVGDFFNTSWSGLTPIATTGADNKVGSTRTFRIPTTKGTYDITEVLTSHLIAPTGAFIFTYEQTTPVKYSDGSGEFAGYWVTFQSDYTFPDESPGGWTSYACMTGHPIDFVDFRTAAYVNASNILKKQGKLTGKTLGPLSAETN